MGVVFNNQYDMPLPMPALLTAAEKIMQQLAIDSRELSVLFCDDEFIAGLNERYLKRTGPTNVISFPQEDIAVSGENGPSAEALIGDVVISVDTAIKEAAQVKQPLETYLIELLLHGILHLVGYDHELGQAEEDEMEEARLNIWAALEN